MNSTYSDWISDYITVRRVKGQCSAGYHELERAIPYENVESPRIYGTDVQMVYSMTSRLCVERALLHPRDPRTPNRTKRSCRQTLPKCRR